jgi:hypothetical protein
LQSQQSTLADEKRVEKEAIEKGLDEDLIVQKTISSYGSLRVAG